VPPVRAGAAMAALADGRALVFGGVDDGGRYRNDAYVLDARRLNWFSLAGIARGAPPKPRAYHTCALSPASSCSGLCACYRAEFGTQCVHDLPARFIRAGCGYLHCNSCSSRCRAGCNLRIQFTAQTRGCALPHSRHFSESSCPVPAPCFLCTHKSRGLRLSAGQHWWETAWSCWAAWGPSASGASARWGTPTCLLSLCVAMTCQAHVCSCCTHCPGRDSGATLRHCTATG